MGWIKLHRKFSDWEWYQDSKMVHLFIHLLIIANHKDNNWQGVEIKRGQLITGRKKLSEETGISEQSIRTCLNKLKMTNELTIKSTNKYSIITICNYDKYQSILLLPDHQINQQSNQQTTSKQPASNHKQEDKELKNKRIKEKKLNLINELKNYLNIYDKEMLNDFFDYWTEPNKSQTKLRYELEKTWDLSRRLKRWAKNYVPKKKSNILYKDEPKGRLPSDKRTGGPKSLKEIINN